MGGRNRQARHPDLVRERADHLPVGRQYARLDPERTDAISAGLDTTRHPGSVTYEDELRARGQLLHARREELQRDGRRLRKEYEGFKDPADRDGWLRLAANLTASASLEDAVADVYDEPALAEEHRAAADRHCEYASNSRTFTDLCLKRAGDL
ncbi:hypothetical protein [Streptomyces griseocarneus]|uniref:hypothetical protein n=1 Tax=Streptomyces griseocarneus TaxID=51201 RepID=UPI00167CB241|nr:hypothetical protein [Streptomyces griseocarneus]MBZ6476261.1 hypothetical protein [Streptomyces griseocarneus]GHG63030.1 hypothetical protein GCM10018779_32230 [Streptomyces griseocarneus]